MNKQLAALLLGLALVSILLMASAVQGNTGTVLVALMSPAHLTVSS